jgi:hypothetical protein
MQNSKINMVVATWGLTDDHSAGPAGYALGCTHTNPHTRTTLQKQWVISTRLGLLPNDIDAMYSYWNGRNCSNGMNECMHMDDFKIWWAEKIADAFEKYASKPLPHSHS